MLGPEAVYHLNGHCAKNSSYHVYASQRSGTGAGYREREKMQQGESLLPTRVTLSTEGVVLGPRLDGVKFFYVLYGTKK